MSLVLDIHAECSRSYVRYMCFVQYSSLECFVSHSVQCVVSSFVKLSIRPLLVVNVFLVTQSSRRACGRAVIIIHYSIIFGCGLPVQIEHFLLYLNRMYYANTIEHAQCK